MGLVTYPSWRAGPGTIQGELTVEGNLTVNGQTTTVDDVVTTDVFVDDSGGTTQFHADGDAGTPFFDYTGNELQNVGPIRSGATGDPSLTPGSPFVLAGADMRFDGITGTPTFGGHDHSAGGMTQVANAGVVGLDQFGANDQFSAYPIDLSGDTDGTFEDGESLTFGTQGDRTLTWDDVNTQFELAGGDMLYLGLGGNPSMGTHDHSEVGTTTVPNAGLTNDTITVNGGTDINGGSAALGGTVTVDHADTSIQGNVATGGATVIDDIDVDGRGHVTNMNTQNRSLDDWGNPNANIDFDGNDILDLSQLVFRDRDGDGVNWAVTPGSGSGHLRWFASGGGGVQMDLEHNGNLRIEGSLSEGVAL